MCFMRITYSRHPAKSAFLKIKIPVSKRVSKEDFQRYIERGLLLEHSSRHEGNFLRETILFVGGGTLPVREAKPRAAKKSTETFKRGKF